MAESGHSLRNWMAINRNCNHVWQHVSVLHNTGVEFCHFYWLKVNLQVFQICTGGSDKTQCKFLMKRKHKPEKRPSVMISYHWKNYTVTLTHFPSKNMREKIDVIPRSCFVRILMILSRIQPLGKSWWQVVKLAINPQRRKYDWMIMLITEA